MIDSTAYNRIDKSLRRLAGGLQKRLPVIGGGAAFRFHLPSHILLYREEGVRVFGRILSFLNDSNRGAASWRNGRGMLQTFYQAR